MNIAEDGEPKRQHTPPQKAFACMLGGDDGRTLIALCAPSAMPADIAGKPLGAIYPIQL